MKEFCKRLISLSISFVFFVMLCARKRIFKLFGIHKSSCIILYYHAVTKEQRRKFAKQMDDLVRWTKPTTANSGDIPEDGHYHVAITFDDAFISIVDNVLPDLNLRKIPVTIFVPTGYLGKHPDWDIAHDHPDRNETVMSPEMIKNLKSDTVSFGSHCITHPHLCSLNEGDAKREIFQSQHDLINIIGEEVKTLSFPHGEFTSMHVEFAREAKYERVFSISPAFAFMKPFEYITGRVKVDPTDWRLEFILKIMGGYCWLPSAYALKRKILKFKGFLKWHR